jgi:hypothetical protein
MKRISLVASLAAAAMVVLTVSSCAPAVHPTSAPTAAPHATVKPHPHATQAATPSVRVAVKCASLLTDSAVAAMIGSPVKHRRDETTPAIDVTDITARQYGSLDCLWGGDPEDSGYDQYLSIDITPDATAGFNANLAGFASEDPPTTSNTAGDKSVHGCTVDGDLHCSGNMLVGSFWVSAYVQNLGAGPVSLATANANIQQILTTVASSLTTAKARTAWKPPAGTLPTFCAAASSDAAVNSALGGTDFALAGSDDELSDAASYTQQPGVYTQCTWGSASSTGPFTYLSIAILRGGAWVLPQLPGESNSKAYMLGAYTSMTIPGATAAAGNCSTDADECLVAVSLGSTLVVINMDDPSDAQATAALAKIVADIKAS